MKSKNIIRASFEIYGFNHDPSELTLRLGVTPSSVSKKGEMRLIGSSDRPAKLKVTQNTWSLDSTLDTSYDLEQHIEQLLGALTPHKEEIKKVTNVSKARFRCTLLLDDPRPGFIFSQKQLSSMSELNAILDLDFYFLGDSNSDR
ncbi:MAG TPA: DUF4279 domain-containing protein [Bacillota bacterium]|nr:DUF4279 domain-containing protein [Bacillota bacterium]